MLNTNCANFDYQYFASLVPAKIENTFTVSSVKKGESAKIDCTAKGDRPITINWFKGTQEISRTRSERYEVFETLTDTGVKSELLIRSADREDGSLYVCKAENSYGKDEKSSKLLVLEVPAAPSSLILHEVWSRSASVSWSAPFSGNTPITGYIVQFWKESHSGENKRLLEETITSSLTSFMLRNLEPGSVYEVSVAAANDVGRGTSSNIIKFKTGEEEPSSPPLDVTAEPKGPTTLRLSWKPPPEDKCHGTLLGFYVGYKHVSDYNKPFTYRTVVAGSFNQTYEYFLTGLKKGSDYTIIVKAFNSAGSGVDSQEIVAKTMLGDVPSAPKVFLFPVTTNSVSLFWKIHEDPLEAKLVGYTVHYRPEYSTSWKEVNVPVEVQGSQQEFTIKDLEANTLYHFYVTASNAFGHGDPSPILSVKTRGVEDESLITGNVMTHPGVIGHNNIRNHFHMDMMSFISIIGASVVVIVVIIISYVCVKKANLNAKKPQLSATYAEFLATTIGRAPGGSDGDNKSVYMGPHHRYVEFDATGRPVKQGNVTHVVDAQGNMFPAPYASLSVPAHAAPVSFFLSLSLFNEFPERKYYWDCLYYFVISHFFIVCFSLLGIFI